MFIEVNCTNKAWSFKVIMKGKHILELNNFKEIWEDY